MSVRVNRVVLTARESLPVYLDQRTFAGASICLEGGPVGDGALRFTARAEHEIPAVAANTCD
jgi:hypothetical protein